MSSNSLPASMDTQVTCPNCNLVFAASLSQTEGE